MSEICPAALNAMKRLAVMMAAAGIGFVATGCSDEPGAIDVMLTAQVPDVDAGRSLRWSHKKEKWKNDCVR